MLVKDYSTENKLYINEEECMGCRSCEEICKEVFNLNEQTDKAEVIKAPGDPKDLIEDAIGLCTAECIHWEE